MKTRFLIATTIVIGIIISGIAAYLFVQMYDCMYPPVWMKTPRSGLDHCWELFLNGHLPDWSDAREDHAKKQTHKLESIERYKNKSEVVAFHARYNDVNVSVRDDHISYFAGNDDGFQVRMNIHFDDSYEITHLKFYCWTGNELHREVAQEDVLGYLENQYCMASSEKNSK